jgi:O-antigen/teichoic acid export membrane protein
VTIFRSLKRLLHSESRRNAVTLVTGTGIAQLVPLAASPVLARLFAPAEFGVLALFSGVVTILAVFSTLRYSQAILIPTHEGDVLELAVLCTWLTTVFSLAILVGMLAMRGPLEALLGVADFAWWVVLAPLSVLLTGATATFYLVCNWRREYKAMAGSRIAQWSVTTIFQLALGFWIGGTALALILGFVAGLAAGLGVLLHRVKVHRLPWHASSRECLLAHARRFRDFPIFSLPADFIGNIANQAPVFLLNSYFGTGVVGLYNVTSRMLSAPVTLIATSINQVGQERAARYFAERGECHDIYVRTLRTLFLLAIVPSLVLFLVIPDAFAFILGPRWREAGEYARIMVPLFFLRFMASPLSFVFYIAEKQRYDLAWQVGLLVVTAGTIAIGGVAGDPKLAILLYTVGYSAMYIVYLILSYRIAKGERSPSLLRVQEFH